jgi:hypothetical protein
MKRSNMNEQENWVTTALGYFFGEISDEEFEKYVNENNSIESKMAPDDYLDLISNNYTRKPNRHELRNILEKYVSDSYVESFQIKSMLRRFIAGIGDPAQIIDDLYNKMDRHIYVYNLAIHSVLGVDDLPRLNEKNNWNEKEFEKTRKWFTDALPEFRKIAMLILESFDNGDLKETNESIVQSDRFKIKMEKYDIKKRAV